jgi:hypothetical protein
MIMTDDILAFCHAGKHYLQRDVLLGGKLSGKTESQRSGSKEFWSASMLAGQQAGRKASQQDRRLAGSLAELPRAIVSTQC